LSHRYKDVIIFEFPALVGLAFSIPAINTALLVNLAVFMLAGFLLMSNIFYFNDWSDSGSDSKVDIKSGQMHSSFGLTTSDLLTLSVISGGASLAIFAFLSLSLFVIALIILLLGIVYSFPDPRFKGKGIPLLSSFLHIAGAILTFLLGYNLYSFVDLKGILIGGYFAILLTAGHLVQEVQDHAGDQQTQIKTNAVMFGQGKVFMSGFTLFIFSFVYLFGIAQFELVPPILKYLAVFLPVFIGLGVRAFKAGFSHEAMNRFRSNYRILFGLVVIIMVFVSVMASLLE
jgi:4-hydroxybenzoate polyprenyltransferase